MRLWICEKRDQAKNIAPLLGNPKPGQAISTPTMAVSRGHVATSWNKSHRQAMTRHGKPGISMCYP